MTLRTITYDDEQWQVVPVFLDECMLDVLQGCIDGDSDATVAWSSVLVAAPEPPAQQPMTEEQIGWLAEELCEWGEVPEEYLAERVARAYERVIGIGKGT